MLNLVFFVIERELNFDFVILNRSLCNRLLFITVLIRQSIRHTVHGHLLVVVVFFVFEGFGNFKWMLRLPLASKNANNQRNYSN